MPGKRDKNKKLLNYWFPAANADALRETAKNMGVPAIDLVLQALEAKSDEWGMQWPPVVHGKYSNRHEMKDGQSNPVIRKRAKRKKKVELAEVATTLLMAKADQKWIVAAGGQHLKKVDLHDIWQDEARDFAPWLAQEGTLDVLSKTLGLGKLNQLEGRPEADLACTDHHSGQPVLILHSLETTQDKYLARALKAAQSRDISVVWLAKRFTEEHRQVLDWLNANNKTSVDFYGLEIELWKFGGSAIAPKFNLIAKPYSYARRQAEEWYRSLEDAEKRILNKNMLMEGEKVMLCSPIHPNDHLAKRLGLSLAQLEVLHAVTRHRLRADFRTDGFSLSIQKTMKIMSSYWARRERDGMERFFRTHKAPVSSILDQKKSRSNSKRSVGIIPINRINELSKRHRKLSEKQNARSDKPTESMHVKAKNIEFSVQPEAFIVQSNGAEFLSPEALPVWSELTIELPSPVDQSPIHCSGIVVGCNGSKANRIVVSILFVGMDSKATAIIERLAGIKRKSSDKCITNK